MLVTIADRQTRGNHVGVIDSLHLQLGIAKERAQWAHLVHIILVNPRVKGLVDNVEHIKQLQGSAAPNRLWKLKMKHLARSLNPSISEKRMVADSNISEVDLLYFKSSATVLGSI